MRLPVEKTIKLFMGGQFPRTESGRSFVLKAADGSAYARCCLGSRKDVRNSVEWAKKAQPLWNQKTSYHRAQILYRIAEMMQGKEREFVEALEAVLGMKAAEAKNQVQEAIDIFVYYAGFADKYQQIVSAINPVSGPFHNFTFAEPMGIIGSLFSEDFNFVTFIDHLASCISSGNVLVVMMGFNGACILAPLAESLQTSDLPGGVVNLISGDTEELYSHLASHMEVQGIYIQDLEEEKEYKIKELSVENLKRVIRFSGQVRSLENIVQFNEYKTVWQPVGQ